MLMLKGHGNYITGVQFNPFDQNILVSCAYDGLVKLWDITTQKCLQTFSPNEGDKKMCFHDLSINGHGVIATGTNNGQIILWDVNSGKIVKTLEGHTDMVLAVNFSEDGAKLFSGCKDTSVRVWNLKM